MSLLNFLTSHAARMRHKTEINLQEYSRPSKDFFLLIALASAMASIGLVLNNTSVIIGAMVVAPLITPIFGLALSIIVLRTKNLGLSLLSIILGTIFAIVTATLTGYIIMFVEGKDIILAKEIIERTHANLLFFLVALLSGIAGARAYSKPDSSATIPGIAISVTLVPPLAVVGLGVAIQNWILIESAFVLYLFNLLGICLGSILTFLFIGFGKDVE